MNEREIGVVLGTLRLVDEEMARLYEGAFPKAREPGVLEKLRHFQQDHKRHMREIDDLTQRLSITLRPPVTELRPLLDDRREAIGWAADEAAMFRELLAAEQFAAFAYGEPTEMHMQPIEVTHLVDRHHDDEVRHSQFCRQQVAERATAAVR